jgi:hypothetical protein
MTTMTFSPVPCLLLLCLWWTQTSHGFSSDAFVTPRRCYGRVSEGRRACAAPVNALTSPLGLRRLSSSSSSSDNNNNNDSGDDIPEDIIAEANKIDDEQERTDYLDETKSAQAFINSLMQAKYEDIPNSGGMKVLKNILDLESEESKDIVVRNCTIPFWEECLKVVNTPNRRDRVAAIGTPGTGKTTSTPILIRMLLEKNETVVYLVRTEDKSGWYYKFVPDGTGKITTMIFSEKLPPSDIPFSDSTFYIVDPGDSKTSCNPPTDFRPKVIIVASPDPGHWGEREFTKERATVEGTMRFYPVWSKEELMFARPILRPDMTDKTVEDRFLMFGGVPRHVFGTRDDDALLLAQKGAVEVLTADQATCIAYTPEDLAFDYFDASTRSALLAIQQEEDDDGSFEKAKLTFVSSLVYRKVSEKFMALLWNVMLGRGSDGGLVFEDYSYLMRGEARNFTMDKLDPEYELVFEDYACRSMTGEKAMPYKVRNCVGQSDPEYQMYSFLPLGGCKEMRQVNDLVEAARGMPDILFRPFESSYPLIDFLYTNATGHFHAFQATILKKREVNVEGIKKLQETVGGGSKLSLYYIVPEGRFDEFVTDPVNPKMNKKVLDKDISCNFWHVLVQKPAPT